MKRKLLIFMAIAGLLLSAAPVFADLEWELGVGITPIGAEEGAKGDSFLEQMMLSGHVGCSFMWLFYGSVDAIILPPMMTQRLSGKLEHDEEGNPYLAGGYFQPGYLNLFDVGIRPRIGPILAFAEIGANSLYVYKQAEQQLELPPVGFNARAGVGVVLKKRWGITASGTVVFQEFEALTETFSTLFTAMSEGDDFVQDQIIDFLIDNLVPTLTFNLYF
jgi:hypothetical protein